jgi:hypothetical protein
MLRPGRDDVVRGTMTGRDEPIVEFGRPPPTRGETGCRTRGEVDGRALGRDDELRVLGRSVVFRVSGCDTELLVVGRTDESRLLGRLRPPADAPPETVEREPPTAPDATLLGSTSVRLVPPPLLPPLPPPPATYLPGR